MSRAHSTFTGPAPAVDSFALVANAPPHFLVAGFASTMTPSLRRAVCPVSRKIIQGFPSAALRADFAHYSVPGLNRHIEGQVYRVTSNRSTGGVLIWSDLSRAALIVSGP